jgi:nitrate/TMAO reductase-like tetraheme cytochrome c subunit
MLIVPFSRGPEAGDYHAGDTLNCQYCHTMHFSISREVHTAGFIPSSLGPSGPYQKLLKNNPNDLCLSCHDGQLFGYPDVMESYGSTTFIRQGGMLNRIGSSTPYEHWKGHTLGSTATAPGGTFSNGEGFACIDCHMPHGVAAQYRNLWVSANSGDKFYEKFITYATQTNDLSKDVFQRTPSTFTSSGSCGECHPIHGTGLRYSMNDISFNEPNPTRSAFGQWCKSCHTDFHGQGGDSNMGGRSGGDVGAPWLRHPTADVNIGANSNARSSYPIWSTGWDITKRVQTMSSSGTYPATDNTPHCLSCHRGHGSINPFGLIYTNPDGTLAIESTQQGASISNTCKQCHSS